MFPFQARDAPGAQSFGAREDRLAPANGQLKALMKSAKYLMNGRDFLFGLKQQGADASAPDDRDRITVWTGLPNTSQSTLTLWVKENCEAGNTFGPEYR